MQGAAVTRVPVKINASTDDPLMNVPSFPQLSLLLLLLCSARQQVSRCKKKILSQCSLECASAAAGKEGDRGKQQVVYEQVVARCASRASGKDIHKQPHTHGGDAGGVTTVGMSTQRIQVCVREKVLLKGSDTMMAMPVSFPRNAMNAVLSRTKRQPASEE